MKMLQRLFKVVIFNSVLLASAQDSFLLTQCDCVSEVSSPLAGGDNFVSDLTAADGTGLACPTDAVRGFTRDFDASQTDSFEFIVDPSFFNNDASTVAWSLVIDFNTRGGVLGEVYNLVNIPLPVAIGVTISRVLDGQGNPSLQAVFTEDGAPVQTSNIIVNGDAQYQIFITQLLGGLVTVNYSLLSKGNGQEITGFTQTDAEGSLAPLPITLLDGTGNPAGSITINSIIIEKDNPIILATALPFVFSPPGTALAFVNSLTDLDIPALPVLDPLFSLETDEDTVLNNVDIGSNLIDSTVLVDFVLDDTPLRGTIAGFDPVAGTFDTYTPVLNDFGVDIFNVDYTPLDGEVPYECTLTLEIPIEVLSVEDVPTLVVVDDQLAFAFINTEFSVIVAESVDFPEFGNILQDGFVVIETVPATGFLKRAGCATELQVGDSVDLVNGFFNFCFEGIGDNGDSDNFTYVVLPPSGDVANQAEGVGTVLIDLENPFFINLDSDTRSLSVNEDELDNQVVIAEDVFFLVDPDANVAEVDFGIVVLTLPDPSVGQFTLDGNAVVPNTFVSVDDTEFRFNPASGFFNANANGGIENEDNEVIFDLLCDIDERVIGTCPDLFSFELVVRVDGDIVLTFEEQNFGIIVRAVNDENPILEDFPELLTVKFDDDPEVNLLSIDTADEFFVSSDDGKNVFKMGVRFSGNETASLLARETSETDPEVIGFNSLDDAISRSNPLTCIDAGCPVVDIIGTPDRVNQFISDLTFQIANEPITFATTDIFLSGDGVLFGDLVETIEFLIITNAPTQNPTRNPTTSPTLNPTRNPTTSPTFNPTSNPTVSPTSNPTVSPTFNPTLNPTTGPTLNPTKKPTTSPTQNPTQAPVVGDSFIEEIGIPIIAGGAGGICLLCIIIGMLFMMTKRQKPAARENLFDDDRIETMDETKLEGSRGSPQVESRRVPKVSISIEDEI